MASVAVTFMQSNGGLVDADGFRGVNGVLSGPAGGVVGMIAAGSVAGARRLIGFDMGGTSTDVSLVDRRDSAALRRRDRRRAPAGARSSTSRRSRRAAAPSCALPTAGCRSARPRPAPIPGPACYRSRRPGHDHRLQRRARAHSGPPVSAVCSARRATNRSIPPRRARDWRSSRQPHATEAGLDYTVETLAAAFLRGGLRAHGQRDPRAGVAAWARTRRASACCASAARQASMPARSRTCSARVKCCCIRWPACCRPTASA